MKTYCYELAEDLIGTTDAPTQVAMRKLVSEVAQRVLADAIINLRDEIDHGVGDTNGLNKAIEILKEMRNA